MINIIKMETKNDARLVLNVPLFSKLSQKEKNQIIRHAVITDYEKGDLILKKGADNSRVLFLIDGYVKLFAEDPPYKRIFDILKPQRIIGILSLFNTGIYTISAVALTDVCILSFDKTILSELLFLNRGFQNYWMENLSMLTNRYIQFLAFQNKKNVRGRIADVLLYLSENVYESENFHQTLTRREMAELANTSTETVIRIFSEFKRDKIISFKDKSIRILDYGYLNEMRKKG